MLLTVRDVAQRLSVSPSCVYQLVSQGKIRSHRIGVGRGAIRIHPEDLEEYLAYCLGEPPSPRNSLPVNAKLKHLQL